MKKIMAKDNIELKAQNQNLQTKMQENQEKYDDNILKILHKAKEELQNQNKKNKISNLKLMSTIFIKFLFFHQMIPLQKL